MKMNKDKYASMLDEIKKKKACYNYLKDVKVCPFCDKIIDNYIEHMDDEHNRIGVKKPMEKLEPILVTFEELCLKVFSLKYFCDLQKKRVLPLKKHAEKYNELKEKIEKMKNILDLTLSDLVK